MTLSPFTVVAGTFYRAVDARFVDSALRGSRSAGRYSPPDAPTLYLSSSPEGVDAAMVAHTDATTPPRELLTFGKRHLPEDVLASPVIADPLHMLEIVMPCLGGAAVVVA